MKAKEMKKMMESVTKKLMAMSKEELELEMYGPERTMKQEEFDKVFDALQKLEWFDEEDMRYFPQNYSFTSKEFFLFLDYLEEYAKSKDYKPEDESEHFAEEQHHFIYKNNDFILRKLWGQGCCIQIIFDSGDQPIILEQFGSFKRLTIDFDPEFVFRSEH